MKLFRRLVAALLAIIAGVLVAESVVVGQVHSAIFDSTRFVAASDVLVEDASARRAVSKMVAERTVDQVLCFAGEGGIESRTIDRVAGRATPVLAIAVERGLEHGRVRDAWHRSVERAHDAYVSDLADRGERAVPRIELGIAGDIARPLLGSRADDLAACRAPAGSKLPPALIDPPGSRDLASGLIALDRYRGAPLLAAVVLIALGLLVMWRQAFTRINILGVVAWTSVGAGLVAAFHLAAARGVPTIITANVDGGDQQRLALALADHLLHPVEVAMLIVLAISLVAFIAALAGRARVRKAQRDDV